MAPLKKARAGRPAAGKSTTTYGFRRTLKSIRPPGKRADPEARKAHKELLTNLLTREKGLKTKTLAKTASHKEDQEYAAEQLLDSRVHKGILQFFVLWEGYPLEESTWEPCSNLKECAELIEEFFKTSPTKPGGPGKQAGRPVQITG